MSDKQLEQRAITAAAYWLDCSPHERTEADGLILAQYAREACEDLSTLRHACLAALGFLGGVSLLTKEQIQKTLADAVRKHVITSQR